MPNETVANEAVKVTPEVAKKADLKGIACMTGGFILGGIAIIGFQKGKTVISEKRAARKAEKAKKVEAEASDEE